MKKMFVGALVALGMMTACDGGPTAKMESELDSMSYAYGVSQSGNAKECLVYNGIDTTYLDEFLKGVYDAYKAEKDQKQMAYFMGLMIGQQICQGIVPNLNNQLFGRDSLQTVNLQAIIAGFCAGAKSDSSFMNIDSAINYYQKHFEMIRKRVEDEKYGAIRKASEQFIAKKAKEAGVKKIADGVFYKVLKEGTGEMPTNDSRVKMNFEGRMIDGTVFMSNYNEKPDEFILSQEMIFPGLTTAITSMPVGSEWEIYLSHEQGYGIQIGGPVPPYSALIFKVRLIEIIK